MKDLRGNEDVFNWNTIVMFGLNENITNKKVINLLMVLVKNAIWKRRNVAKNRNYVADVWMVFKGLVENYGQTLFTYFEMEKELDTFHKMFPTDVLYTFKKYKIKLPKKEDF